MQRDPYSVVESYGYNPRTTPVDTLMNAPYGMHLEVAEAMENDEHQDPAEA